MAKAFSRLNGGSEGGKGTGNPFVVVLRELLRKYAGGILNPASLIREAVCPKPADESEKRAFNELAVVDAITICPRRNSSPTVPVFSATGWKARKDKRGRFVIGGAPRLLAVRTNDPRNVKETS
ncbi:unnamed protein product [Lasius platythorax]|uniref:Uncharacterized protein n=1 Tax=Lasius platythorax TaxID=488582 RepID=A0AAV2NPL5_9HYME